MNTETVRQAIEVMQHYLKGGAVEVYIPEYERWVEVTSRPIEWNWRDTKYRISERSLAESCAIKCNTTGKLSHLAADYREALRSLEYYNSEYSIVRVREVREN